MVVHGLGVSEMYQPEYRVQLLEFLSTATKIKGLYLVKDRYFKASSVPGIGMVASHVEVKIPCP